MGSDKKRKQNQHERFLLDRFLENQQMSPTDIQQPDPPDFVINLDGRKVAIEVTELFIRSPKSGIHPQPTENPLLQAVERRTNQIISKARSFYLADADNLPVESRIVFSTRITLDKKKDDHIARLVADKVRGMNIQNSQVVEWSASGEEEETPLSDCVHFIHALGVPDFGLARWTVSNCGWVTTLTPRHLQERIAEKTERLNGYKNYVEEVWLLIVADRRRPSQGFICPSDFPWDSLSSPFAKTFYYDYTEDKVIEFSRNSVKSSTPDW